jgi:hypothetical protein
MKINDDTEKKLPVKMGVVSSTMHMHYVVNLNDPQQVELAEEFIIDYFSNIAVQNIDIEVMEDPEYKEEDIDEMILESILDMKEDEDNV